MRLFIAEKPSLARAIADALPGPQRRAPLHIECAEGDVVAWCAGHILHVAPPEAYAEECKVWRLEHLPIAPRDWRLQVSAPALLTSIARLLKTATRVVHAGDPDREGQLLVDEVLHFLGYRGPVDRLLVRDLSPEAVRTQLAALEPNAKYRPLYESALARQRADWLYGINMTRLYTLLGRAAGYEGVLSVGRVQTPLLGLIVARDAAIAGFRPVPYYVVSGEVRAGGGERFPAFWVPPDGAPLDEDGRLRELGVAQAACQRVAGQQGRVTACTQDDKSEAPPLPYSLSDLQVDAGRRLGLSAQAVLDACQGLYETHRLLTYPRSDCAYLPEGQHAQAKDVLAAVARQAPVLGAAVAKADLTLRSRAWNDKRVTAHHAIVPTAAAGAPRGPLSEEERAVYELVARRYLAQFCALTSTSRSRLSSTSRASGSWPAAATPRRSDGRASTRTWQRRARRTPTRRRARAWPPCRTSRPARASRWRSPRSRASAPALPSLSPTPPSSPRCAAWRSFVRRPDIKKILTEADGIGTPATRAAILETLFERGYVERVQRTIVSTETGRALIGSLPEVATTPDRTAVWEAAMRAIAEGEQTLDAFLGRVRAELEQLVAEGRALGRIAIPPTRAAAARPPRRPASTPRGRRHPRNHSIPHTGRQRKP